MSIEVMTRVWNQSRAEGTELLILLAIADFADERGTCWPSVGKLAERGRVDRRTVQRILRKLVAMGELRVDEHPGRSHVLCVLTGGDNLTHPSSKGGDIAMSRGGDIAMSHEPSRTKTLVSTNVLTPQQRKNGGQRPRDPLWDALAEELGEPVTKSERGRRNRALKELRDVAATADDLRRRIAAYRRRWPGIELTASALAANWSVLAPTNWERDPEERMREAASRREAEKPWLFEGGSK